MTAFFWAWFLPTLLGFGLLGLGVLALHGLGALTLILYRGRHPAAPRDPLESPPILIGLCVATFASLALLTCWGVGQALLKSGLLFFPVMAGVLLLGLLIGSLVTGEWGWVPPGLRRALAWLGRVLLRVVVGALTVTLPLAAPYGLGRVLGDVVLGLGPPEGKDHVLAWFMGAVVLVLIPAAATTLGIIGDAVLRRFERRS